jgi:two-component system LytT family response regulator
MVVDDEAMARERVVGMLRQEQDIELIGECSDGQQAVDAINTQHPDLVFLDVQMPACDAFGVIEKVGADKMPAVVFVTAYDEYALRAFEVHAIDYLLKPFGRERFQQTLQHARAHVERRRAGDLGKRLMALVQDIKPEPQRLDRMVVKSGGRVFFRTTDDIVWMKRPATTSACTADESLFRETMNGIRRGSTRRFVRIHRSRIVTTASGTATRFNGGIRGGAAGRHPPHRRGYREAPGAAGQAVLTWKNLLWGESCNTFSQTPNAKVGRSRRNGAGARHVGQA